MVSSSLRIVVVIDSILPRACYKSGFMLFSKVSIGAEKPYYRGIFVLQALLFPMEFRLAVTRAGCMRIIIVISLTTPERSHGNKPLTSVIDMVHRYFISTTWTNRF